MIYLTSKFSASSIYIGKRYETLFLLRVKQFLGKSITTFRALFITSGRSTTAFLCIIKVIFCWQLDRNSWKTLVLFKIAIESIVL